MEAVRTSETSVDNHSTRQYNPEDSSEHHTRRRENLKSHKFIIQNDLKQGEDLSPLIFIFGLLRYMPLTASKRTRKD
jgi:hypothetical protein